MPDLKGLLPTPAASWLFGIGCAALVGVWWHRMNPHTANLTLAFGVLAIAASVWLHPLIASQGMPIRALWFAVAFSGLSLLAYYTLWTEDSTALETPKREAKAFPHESKRSNEPEVSVHPNEMVLWKDGWRHKPSTVLTNHATETKYEVWVEIYASGTASAQDIEITPDENPEGPKLHAGPIEYLADAFVLDLEDAAGKVFSLVRFYEIAPGERRRINLRSREGLTQDLSAQVKVVGHSASPPPLMEKRNQAAFMFKPPVEGKLLAIRNKLGKTGGGSGELRIRIAKP